RITHTVPADHRAFSFHHLGEPAGQNSFQDVQVALFGKADHGQGTKRTAAHGVDVAQRVGGRNLSEGVGIVHNRSKEIYSLDQRLVGGDFVHAGVVGGVKADQNIWVMLPG